MFTKVMVLIELPKVLMHDLLILLTNYYYLMLTITKPLVNC